MMNAMVFGYVQAREIEIRHAQARRWIVEDAPSLRDRLGRTLISWGQHLVAIPRAEPAPLRRVA